MDLIVYNVVECIKHYYASKYWHPEMQKLNLITSLCVYENRIMEVIMISD